VSTWLQRALARREPVPTEPEAPSGGPSGSARQPVSIVPKGPRPEANGTNGTNGTAAVVIYIDPQERAAIAEHDGHVPRHFALGFAMLQAEHGENSAVMDDVGAFLDRWGRLADALGWTAEDLFRREPPGLCRVLTGQRIVALDGKGATLMPGGRFPRLTS
jgi:hypothetical protein